MPKPGSVTRFQTAVRARCPCGCEVSIGYSEGVPSVVHPLPTCKLFDTFDSPVDYVHFLNLDMLAQAKEHCRRASSRHRIPQA